MVYESGPFTANGDASNRSWEVSRVVKEQFLT